MNGTHHHYRVGGHLFSLALPPELVPAAALAPYAPFRTEEPGADAAPLFSLTLTAADHDDASGDGLPAAASSLIRLDDDNGSMELFTIPSGGLLIHFALPDRPVCCRLSMDSRYRDARAVLRGDARERRYALDNSLMLLYAFASAPHATLLLHASVIENDGRGYLFLGRSGTGKSTHSCLWTEHIPGSRLLNDDNPVLRLTPDGLPIAYGSPWSGKTPCYRNLGIPAAAFVRLTQAPRNSITRLRGVPAYAALMPSCSCMKWDAAMAAAIHRTLERLTAAVPVFRLECLPDADAARLCAQAVTASDAAHTPGHAESAPRHAEPAPCHSERSEICGQASAETKLVSAMPSVSKSETAQPDQPSQATAHAPCHAERSEASPTTALRGKRFFATAQHDSGRSPSHTRHRKGGPPMRQITLPNSVLLPEVARLLREGESVALKAKGNSMLPFITGGRDSVVLRPVTAPAVGDIVLAHLGDGHYVLHRIIRISATRITLMGDGNLRGTECCTPGDIAGQAVRILKPRRTVDCTSPAARRRARLWMALLPVRRYLLAVYRRTSGRHP